MGKTYKSNCMGIIDQPIGTNHKILFPLKGMTQILNEGAKELRETRNALPDFCDIEDQCMLQFVKDMEQAIETDRKNGLIPGSKK